MDGTQLRGSTIALGVFSATIFIVASIRIYVKNVGKAEFLRLFSVIPYGIYAGNAIQRSFKRRYDGSGNLLPLGGSVWVSEVMHGLVGVSLSFWAIIGFWVVRQIKKNRWPHSSNWKHKHASTGYLYVVIVDLIFITALTAAMAMSSMNTPWSFGRCWAFEVQSSREKPTTAVTKWNCRQSLTIQIMALILVFVIAFQSAIIAPLLAIPTTIRAPIFSLIRPFRQRKHHHHHQQNTQNREYWRDPEAEGSSTATGNDDDDDDNNEKKGHDGSATWRTQPPPSATLASVFRIDAVAARVASHLHFSDVANLAMTSKVVRGAMLYPMFSEKDRVTRVDMFCEAACEDGFKSECWACAQLICEACQVNRDQVPIPRTDQHTHFCYAVCSKCYFLELSTQPSPLSGAWNPSNLSSQHLHCQASNAAAVAAIAKRNNIRTKVTAKTAAAAARPLLKTPVAVCQTCARLGDVELSAVREQRDTAALGATLLRKIRCRRCEKSLSAKKRRWWVCEISLHDCHWDGHDVKR